MPKILIAGAGGAPSEGVIFSLKKNMQNEIVGMGSEPTDLALSLAERRYFVPYANSDNYKESLLKILNKEKPDLVHFQNDLEIFHASQLREEILSTGTKIFMPEHNTIDACVHKNKSYEAFVKAGIKVPRNINIKDRHDLEEAFRILADKDGKVWLRSNSIGGGGKGALPTNDIKLAEAWLNHYKGWGDFSAAEMLTNKTVTWLSIWFEGNLIVAQTRARSGWTHGNRTISGVTGVTKVGITTSCEKVTDIAIQSIKAISDKPHGIFGVDMAYDDNGIPNPTEINISRFFTTVRFFTEAGLNMPEIFKCLALGEHFETPSPKINPLKNDLLWLRGMDTQPRLLTNEDITKEIFFL